MCRYMWKEQRKAARCAWICTAEGPGYSFHRCGTGEGWLCGFREEVETPWQWSAESPSLYTVVLTLVAGDEETILACRCGFRTFELKDGLMMLNNRRIVFREQTVMSSVPNSDGQSRRKRCCRMSGI